MMLLRLSTLATGRTGVRPEVAQAYAGLLSAGLTPVIYEYGSLGCSGDLAPLAHVALAIMGEGQVRTVEGELVQAAEALTAHGLRTDRPRRERRPRPHQRHRRDARTAGPGVDRSRPVRWCLLADVSAAMSVEGLLGSDRVFAPHLQALRPSGQAVAAANMTRVLADSPIVASHSGPDCSLVQDAYSLRCAPQVAGAAPDTVAHARNVATWELASTIDNPVVTLDGQVGIERKLPAHPSHTCSTSSPSSSPIREHQ